MSLPIRLQSADGVKISVDVLHIFDVMDGVIVGDFNEHRAAESVLRESQRLFEKPCKILGEMHRFICLAQLVSYKHAAPDSDGSQMLVAVPMSASQSLTPLLTLDEAVMSLEWKNNCEPFDI